MDSPWHKYFTIVIDKPNPDLAKASLAHRHDFLQEANADVAERVIKEWNKSSFSARLSRASDQVCVHPQAAKGQLYLQRVKQSTCLISQTKQGWIWPALGCGARKGIQVVVESNVRR